MSNTQNENVLEQLGQRLSKIQALIRDPQPGLMSWNKFFYESMENLFRWWYDEPKQKYFIQCRDGIEFVSLVSFCLGANITLPNTYSISSMDTDTFQLIVGMGDHYREKMKSLNKKAVITRIS